MSDFLKILTRKNSLRKQCQELSVAELEKVISDLTVIADDRREEEAAIQAAEQEKLEKIEAIRQSMLDAGVDMNDLMGMIGDVAAPKKKVQPKYRVVDDAGVEHEWSGRGRTPLAFQAYFEKGFTKDDCLI
ncbi:MULTISPECIES: H-NS family nucleoid-associated regulatory protein [Neptuniibacter]|jgi:DNA-binding protein H-NS|uniref:H-NS histone family protein n=1 Tax=Neptuniibacter TaxID=459520 RepID=UPI00082E47BB|nr:MULTISPECIES: H-NS family nucleoid-associated regulatory protein [Neptuniibacter]MDO6512924.1 H-NS family nucleoid-associated regulatory protein [Neptuniibacter sp. 2_MG-2023]MDO6592881.1 H-NS family nucleoid-associated regulatory protein [Neptuniibacter sp. 1_MG-2023]